MREIQLAFHFFFSFLREFWWFILPPILFFIWRDLWLHYRRRRYILSLDWVTLRLKVPPEVLKTPKAMEQFFAAIHAAKTSPNWRERYLKGEVPTWLSFEIVGIGGGGIYFFIRTPKKYRDLIESQLYAQYPDIEIYETEDYPKFLPPHLPDKNYDLWGTELALEKDDPYPIRTYQFFEDQKEEKRLDPLAGLVEWLNRLRDGEQIWMQIVLEPTGSDFKKKGEEIIAKLIGKPEEKKKSSWAGVEWPVSPWEFFVNFIKAPFEAPTWSEGKKEDKEKLPSKVQFLSSGEKEIVEAIEKKIAKLGYEGGIRVLYIGKRDVFSKANIAAINAYFRQFNTQNLNAFKSNSKVATKVEFWFKNHRENLRKAKIYRYYRERERIHKKSVFNVEELATLYHFPLRSVTAPTLERIYSRKGAPPSNLPI